MKFTFLLFSFAVANLFNTAVDGATLMYEEVYCSLVMPNETVCAVATYATPFPDTFDNGTEFMSGTYRHYYDIVTGLKEGDVCDVLGSYGSDPANLAGIHIKVDLGDADSEKCSVYVSESMHHPEIVCNKCEYCGEGSYKADCSNIKNGRNMTDCVKLAKDAMPKDVIFFPFNASAVPKEISPVQAPVSGPPTRAPITPRTMKPTRAPRTMKPTRAPRTMKPTRAPRTMKPTRAPRTMSPTRAPQTKSPARSPVTKPRTAPVPTP